MATVDYFERKLDDKRRLTIPVEIRHEFESGVVVTRGFSNYLHVYPKSVWDEQVEPLLQGNILDENTADLNVKFRTGKCESPLDQKQGSDHTRGFAIRVCRNNACNYSSTSRAILADYGCINPNRSLTIERKLKRNR
jgi:hypothetical protein